MPIIGIWNTNQGRAIILPSTVEPPPSLPEGAIIWDLDSISWESEIIVWS